MGHRTTAQVIRGAVRAAGTACILTSVAACSSAPQVYPGPITVEEVEALAGHARAAWTWEANPNGPGYFAGPEGGQLRYYEPSAGHRRYARQLAARTHD